MTGFGDRWRAEGWHGTTTLGRAMSAGVQRNPGGRLVYWSKSRPAEITLRRLHDSGIALAGSLAARGLRQGDVVVAQVPNWVEGALLWYAANQLGLVVVPVVHIYGPTELGYIVRDANAKALVVPDHWGTTNFVERLH